MVRRTREYMRVFLLTALNLSALLGVFNLIVDPYGLFDLVTIEGWSDTKPETTRKSRLHKAFAVERIKPAGLILGSSRAERGLDPAHWGWRAAPVYNLGLPGADIFELRDALVHANAVSPLRQVVLSLDLLLFDARRGRPPDVDYRRLRDYGNAPWLIRHMPDLVDSLLSYDALTSSVRTLLVRDTPCVGFVKPDGTASPDTKICAVDTAGQRRLFQLSERGYLLVWKTYKDLQLRDPRTGRSSLDAVRDIVALARRDRIDLRMLISPVHARQLEVIRAAGAWPVFEQWKRELVALLAQGAAAHPGQAKIPLWDFSGYSAINQEPVPPKDDDGNRMWGYWEASHFRMVVGDRVLDRVLGYPDTAGRAPAGFGVLLTQDNIEAQLRALREGRERYRQAFSDDVREIQWIAAGRRPGPEMARKPRIEGR